MRLNLFHTLRDIGIADKNSMFQVMMEAIFLKHDLSGEQWDD